MKYFITILFIWDNATAQNYVAKWATVPKEQGIINYQVQYSKDSAGPYNTLPNGTIQPQKKSIVNNYTFTLPSFTINYYRIKALYSKGIIYTNPIKVINTNVAFSNLGYGTNTNADKLSFTANNETEVSYYSIERKNSSSSSWVIVGKLAQTGKKNYTVNISKIGSNRNYKMRAVYKNELTSPYINF